MVEGEGPSTDAEPEEGSSLHVQGAAMYVGSMVGESCEGGGGGEVGLLARNLLDPEMGAETPTRCRQRRLACDVTR
jgi:hypothetical protein